VIADEQLERQPTFPYLSFARCRELARTVRAADCGREATRLFRPIGALGLVRSRAPLAIALYLADRDNVLVNEPSIGFAVLQPHGRAHRRIWQDGLTRGLLRTADRHWDGLAMLGPSALLFLTAALLGGGELLGRQPALLGSAVVGAVLVTAWEALSMATGLAATIVRGLRTRPVTLDRFAVDTLPNWTWSAALVHLDDPTRARDLVNLMLTHVRRYVRVASEEAVAELDVRIRQVDNLASLLILRRGVTTQAGRDGIAASVGRQMFGSDAEVFLIESPDRGEEVTPPQASGGFFFWYLGVSGAVLAVCAAIVAEIESAACAATSCVGHPASYSEALRWLMQRLWFSDPPDLTPGTVEGVVLGWLTSILTVIGLAVAGVSVTQVWRCHQMLQEQLRRRRSGMVPTPEVVILCAIETEYRAVCEHLANLHERDVNGTLYEVGTYPGEQHIWTIAIGQVGPGGEGAALQVERACAAFAPLYVIFVGVAGGRNEARHGDVVAATCVYDYQTAKEQENSLQPRFKTHHSSHNLVQRAQAVARRGQWPKTILPVPSDPPPHVFVKPIAAGGRLLASERAHTARIITENCADAEAVEMEGFGFLYGAHANASVSAIVVCGISDRFDDKTKTSDEVWQPIAARTAAAFALALFSELRPR
jgi:nucleoside phosphorylase